MLDPERLFGDPAYLMSVALGSGDEDEPRWRLLMLEDCDELISGEAKASAGQSLSRLLNLTDGLLGQGRNALIAITTNEDLASLHPAVVRPGRCLASIEVGRLPYAEAVAWLGTSARRRPGRRHAGRAVRAEDRCPAGHRADDRPGDRNVFVARSASAFRKRSSSTCGCFPSNTSARVQ